MADESNTSTKFRDITLSTVNILPSQQWLFKKQPISEQWEKFIYERTFAFEKNTKSLKY